MSDRIYEVDWISELKDRADIVNIISSYIPLTKKGNLYWGNCPFHHEKTPSFAVNNIGQFYHCFGCGVSGDVIKFVVDYENVEFLDACKILAEKVGYRLPEFSDNPIVKKNISEKEEIYKVLRDTAIFYNKNLLKPEAKIALDYMSIRGLNPDIVKRFGLGYSTNYDDLPKYLKLKNYTDEVILKSNVCGRNERGDLYDALGGRLIIPIINVQNKVIAFGGRILEKNNVQNKYKNTANSPVFIKNKNLFGINLVSKLKQKESVNNIIMVEGYMDVIALNKAGFHNVVASMGTSLTQGQATIVKRFTDNVFVAYDGDKAGQMATMRSLDIFAEQGLNVKVVRLDEGLDPDEIISQKGKPHFVDLITNATPLIDYKLEKIEEKYNLSSLDERAKYAGEAVKMLAEIKENEVREVYLDLVCKKSQIQKHRLQIQLDNPKENILVNTASLSKEAGYDKDNAYTKACRIVLSGMLNNKPYASYRDISKFLKNSTHIAIFDYIKKCREENKYIVIGKLFDHIPEDKELNAVINIHIDNEKQAWEKAEYEQSFNTLNKYYLQDEIEKIRNAIKETADIAAKRDLLNKLRKLQIELNDYNK